MPKDFVVVNGRPDPAGGAEQVRIRRYPDGRVELAAQAAPGTFPTVVVLTAQDAERVAVALLDPEPTR